MKNVIEIVLAILMIVGVAIGGYIYFEERYALDRELKELDTRFEMKVINDHIKELNNKIWQLEKSIMDNPNNTSVKEKIRELKDEKKMDEIKLKVLLTSLIQ